jgi:uncharacterized protein YukE
MTTANWTSVQERSTIHAILLQRFNEKGCLPVVWFGDAQKAFQKVISEQYQTVLMSVAMAFQ